MLAIIGVRAALTACAFGACLAGAAVLDVAAAQSACRQDPTLDAPSAPPPADVCGDAAALAPDFYALSWELFKFLVWPATSDSRGNPDASRTIISMEGPRTFETLKADWEVFRPNAEPPAPWKDHPGVATPCGNLPRLEPGALVLASFSEFGSVTESEPVFSHALVAQNRTYVRYLAGYNEKVFQKIAGGLYDPATAEEIWNAPSKTPVAPEARNDDRAMTVKSAWIELPDPGTSSPYIDPSRFYVRKAWVQDVRKSRQDQQRPDCREIRVGLVGLHIVYKTESRPQWIWSTFEHVDNAPEPTPESGRSYNFHSGDPSAGMSERPDPAFQIPIQAGPKGPGEPPSAYQVQRLQHLDVDVVKANEAWQGKLKSIGSVWQNYKLIMTQWPFQPYSPNGTVDFLPDCAMRGSLATANTTMETFLQTQTDCKVRYTCMGCHDMVRKLDFVWSIRMNPELSRDQRRPDTRANAIKALQEVLQDKLRN